MFINSFHYIEMITYLFYNLFMHAIDGMIFVVLDMIIALENGPCKSVY